MPTNLYGPNDNYDLQNSHVLPALIRKFHEAITNDSKEVVIWGTGSPLREFLHVDDLASACLTLMEKYDNKEFVNIGFGNDISIFDLAQLVKKITGFNGELIFDHSKPDGTARKLMDSSKIHSLGWKPNIALSDGIAATYKLFREQVLTT